MRNKTLLAFAIASCIAAPLAFAQGRGAGGPPTGAGAIGGNAGARIADRASIGVDTASRATMQRTLDRQTRAGFGTEQKTTVQAAQNQTAVDAKLKAETKVRATDDVADDVEDDIDDVSGEPNAKATFGQDTAARAKLQRDADVETRKTFGATQSEAAKAKNDTVDGDDGTDGDTTDDGDDD
jgi:hypothetical protein